MDSDQAKLFVGGISRETNEDNLKEYFSGFGEILETVVAKDRTTGNPRGFGFVRFAESSSADNALSVNHVILGRRVEVKKAVPRLGHLQNAQHSNSNMQQRSSVHEDINRRNLPGQSRTKKVFVGGLSSDLTKEEFGRYFEKFGSITDLVVMHDSANRPRGFGFVTFDSEDSVENVMQNNFHELNNKRVEVKRAIPKEGINSSDGASSSRVGVRNGSRYIAPPYPSNDDYYGTFYSYVPPPGYNVYTGFSYPSGIYGFRYLPMVHDPQMHWHNPAMNGFGYYLPSYNLSMYSSYQNVEVGSLGTVKLNQAVYENGRLSVNDISPQFEGLRLGNDASGQDRGCDSGSN